VKVELCQVGKVGQRGDIAYLVKAEVEPYQIGEVSQRRDIVYLVMRSYQNEKDSQFLLLKKKVHRAGLPGTGQITEVSLPGSLKELPPN
jgi:hypothetical protein